MHVGRHLAARTGGGAAARALESSLARALHRRRHSPAAAAATSTTGEEEEQQPRQQQQDTLRATLRDLPGPVASALADELLLCGAFSASVDEFRPPGGAEQKIFGARGRDDDDEQGGREGSSFPPPSADDSAAVFWDRCTLTAIFERGADVSAALREASLAAGVVDFSASLLPKVELSQARASEWLDALRGAFAPVFVDEGREEGRGLWILPEGCSLPPSTTAAEAEAAAASSPFSLPVVVRLTPGLAFGTGDHPTTRMCLRWLATEEVTRALLARGASSQLLDFGTGSGVLAAAAIALGCRSAVGTDVDPLALTAAAENAALNAPPPKTAAPPLPLLRTVLVSSDPPSPIGAEEKLENEEDPVGPRGSFDVVVANILRGPLVRLAPSLSRWAAPGALVAVSGVLAGSQAADVVSAFSAAGVELQEFDRERCSGGGGDWWVCLSGRKRM